MSLSQEPLLCSIPRVSGAGGGPGGGAAAALSAPLPGPDKAPRLLLAGEHCSPAYWSFLHGARQTGLDQAQRLLEYRADTGEL